MTRDKVLLLLYKMRIFQGYESFQGVKHPVLTIGTFDGVHIGHQKIIEHLNAEAKVLGGESVLLTFYPHPRMILFPESHGLELLQTQEEKLAKLEACGLQNVIIQPFTEQFSRLTALEFVRNILVNALGVKKLIIGYDHQFGRNREGSIEFLKDVCGTYGFEVEEIPAQEVDEVNVSSTKIRKALQAGDVVCAHDYLGEHYSLTGTVVRGKEIGRTIEYPTANVSVTDSAKIIPTNGVYVVKVAVKDKEAFGMLSIGVNPTIAAGNERTIEVHLLDFHDDLYGQRIEVQFLKYLRPELKFDSLEALKHKIREDEVATRTYLYH